MKKLIGTVAFATTLAVAGAAIAQDTIRIGAMPVGSGWYVAAAAIEQALKPVMGSTPVEVIARGGGVANPMVVEQGKAEIAMSNVATSLWAMNGEELYQGKKATHIRSLVGGLNSVYMAAIVKNDFIKKTGLDTMEKIFTSGKPIRIVMKPQGSNVPPTVDMILAATVSTEPSSRRRAATSSRSIRNRPRTSCVKAAPTFCSTPCSRVIR